MMGVTMTARQKYYLKNMISALVSALIYSSLFYLIIHKLTD